MLKSLVGNKTIEKILIFLFVNGKCYGTELHRQIKLPLTPIQKSLARLEKGGIVISRYEGKTRLYQFNPAFPLLTELELLLKKAYTFLSSEEKKDYFVVTRATSLRQLKEKKDVLETFWEKLKQVTQLLFLAKVNSHERFGWQGKGDVSVTKEGDTVLIFIEKGNWQSKKGEVVSFSNIFRWTYDRKGGMVSLEHLRRGWDHPVFLFHLIPQDVDTLASIDSHLCGEDTYFGKISLDHTRIHLNFRVIGPKKNEEINYFYS